MITIHSSIFTNNHNGMAHDKIYPDSELISGLSSKEGLDEAVRVMYRSYYEMSRIYILNNKGQEEDAEDIFQEVVVTFIDLVQKNKFRGESSVRTFLYSLTRHAWLNELKKKGTSANKG